MNAPGDAPQNGDADLRRQAEERIARQRAVLSGSARLFREALTCQTEEELGRVCLAVAEEVTQSKSAPATGPRPDREPPPLPPLNRGSGAYPGRG